MNAILKLRRTGNSVTTTWPKELLGRLGVKEGDSLFVAEGPGGVFITPSNPEFEKGMEAAERAMAKYRNAYAELAKR